MAIAVIQITGSIVTPDSVGFAGGTINVELIPPGSVPDATVEQVIAARSKIPIESDGAVDFNLVPNDIISASIETFYKVTIVHPDGYSWTEFWSIESTGADPIEIGDIQKVSMSSPEYGILVTTLPVASEKYRGKFRVTKGGTDEQDVLWVCLKGWKNTYSWVPDTNGGSGP